MGQCLKCKNTFFCVLFAESMCKGDMSKLNNKHIKRICSLAGGYNEKKATIDICLKKK